MTAINRTVLNLSGLEVPVEVRHSRRSRRPRIRAMADKLEIVLPIRAPKRVLEELIKTHEDWIVKQHLALVGRFKQSEGSVLFRGSVYSVSLGGVGVKWGADGVVSVSTLAALKKAMLKVARVELDASVMRWQEVMDSRPSRVSVRDQRSRWGSCSTRRSLSLNWRLIMAPQFVLDYVVVHELAHLRHPNHSDRFWKEVALFYPDYKKAEQWLKTHNQEVMLAFRSLA